MDNTLTSYCFLAALTENQNDLYNHVYVPICKRALSLYSLRGSSHGTAQDIQEIINEQYGIDVPLMIIRRLIVSVLKSLSKRQSWDVAAYLFVREQRGTAISSFQKGKYWFVTTNYELLLFNNEYAPVSGVTEITLPDALTSMLWLKDPAKLTSQVKKVGLRELMSTTLNEEIASKELIGEFETAISSLDDVSEEDYQILLESVAHQSGKRISEFNELAVHDKNAAKQQAIGIIEKEKTRKVKQAQRIKEAQGAQKQTEDVNHLLNERVRALEEGQAQSETEIEKLSSQIVDQKKFLKRALLWLLLGIILGGVGIWGFRYFSTNVSYIVNGVISLGGLWGFLSFLLNLYRTLRVK